MPRMKRRLARLAVVASVLAVAPAGAPVLIGGGPVAPAVALAKTCSLGFTHAVIAGSEKCLRRGQFCARSSDAQYRRYRYRCQKRDRRGNYHLT
jgi:hypothetical protein